MAESRTAVPPRNALARFGNRRCREVPMRIAILGTAAVALGGLLSLTPVARAADTMMLGGVGSMSSALERTPSVTLQYNFADQADTVEVAHGGGFHGGGFHGGGFHGGGFAH